MARASLAFRGLNMFFGAPTPFNARRFSAMSNGCGAITGCSPQTRQSARRRGRQHIGYAECE
jgi:hypothetical protein